MMGYVVAAWLATGLLLLGYGWSIRQRRRAVAVDEQDDAQVDAQDDADTTGAVVEAAGGAAEGRVGAP